LTRLADGDSTQTRLAAIWQRHGAWIRAFALGGFVGGLVFLAIYLRSYLEHSAFPEEDLVSKLTVRDPSAWSSPLDVIRSLDSYISMRTFLLVCVLASLACVPRIRMDRTARVLALWLLAVSALVALLPLRFNDFSVWKIFFAPLPGFSAIRDPRRIIPVYELAAVLIVAVVLARLPWRAPVRIGVSVALFVLLVTHRNREVFDFLRPVETFERWVAAPIAIDPSCRSFFIKGASAQYMARSNHMWTLYNIDAMFVSLQHGLPTLNGYSAWWPQGWLLANPQEDTYLERVNGWINQRELRDVCAFDIDARRMTPYHASSR
jgi:hypothetical protein